MLLGRILTLFNDQKPLPLILGIEIRASEHMTNQSQSLVIILCYDFDLPFIRVIDTLRTLKLRDTRCFFESGRSLRLHSPCVAISQKKPTTLGISRTWSKLTVMSEKRSHHEW